MMREVELQGEDEDNGGGLEVGGQLIGKVVVGVRDGEDEYGEDNEGGDDNKRALTTAVEGALAVLIVLAVTFAIRNALATATIFVATIVNCTPHPCHHRPEHILQPEHGKPRRHFYHSNTVYNLMKSALIKVKKMC
ncbi:uncharacterized protein BcabD6B2_52100 [Babesia caballi]|uniref:Uncharacterized protein n=1 Tax=Babesia caballi TaxID=5871 RepID=A0AAV4M1K1_BABCB|nr:hypothetical protein BcabD6B2_52100 [Babesia caballi]